MDVMTAADSNRQSIKDNLFSLVKALMVLYVVEIACWRVAAFCNNHFQPSVMRDMFDDIFARLHRHSVEFFSNHFIGSLVTKSRRLVNGFERIMDLLYWQFLRIFVLLLSTVIVLFTIEPVFGWIFLAWALVYGSVTIGFNLWRMKYDLLGAEIDSKVTGRYADSLTNFLNVKIFSRREHEQAMFGKITEEQKRVRKFNWDLNEYGAFVQAFLTYSLEFGTLFLSLYYWMDNRITTGSVVLINALNTQLVEFFWNIGKNFRDLLSGFADCKEMIDLINRTDDVKNPENPEVVKINKGEIHFDNVSFEYLPGKPVFKDFNLIIRPGERVGLVGKSGAGKSTFSKLLMRFVDVSSGRITIDGQDIRNVNQDDLRRQIVLVPQEPVLFHRSLRENILYGNLQANEDKLLEVARRAHAHEFITQTSNSYETLVGERGVKLSGGERQRIAIARAMLSDSPILLLDEATSALDSESELKIQQGLSELMQDRTTIVIAHRLSTLKQMDRILYLENGQVVEEGSHQELLALNARYAQLWTHQAGGFV